MKVLRMGIVGVVLMTGASGGLSGGQTVPPPIQQPMQDPIQQPRSGFPGNTHNPMDSSSPLDGSRAEQQEKARSTDRQKRLVADTDKLLALATDLKQQVDKTNQNILSVDVIKKADEIEKLAHSVKERMKG
jgi:hypothetical protein